MTSSHIPPFSAPAAVSPLERSVAGRRSGSFPDSGHRDGEEDFEVSLRTDIAALVALLPRPAPPSLAAPRDRAESGAANGAGRTAGNVASGSLPRASSFVRRHPLSGERGRDVSRGRDTRSREGERGESAVRPPSAGASHTIYAPKPNGLGESAHRSEKDSGVSSHGNAGDASSDVTRRAALLPETPPDDRASSPGESGRSQARGAVSTAKSAAPEEGTEEPDGASGEASEAGLKRVGGIAAEEAAGAATVAEGSGDTAASLRLEGAPPAPLSHSPVAEISPMADAVMTAAVIGAVVGAASMETVGLAAGGVQAAGAATSADKAAEAAGTASNAPSAHTAWHGGTGAGAGSVAPAEPVSMVTPSPDATAAEAGITEARREAPGDEAAKTSIRVVVERMDSERARDVPSGISHTEGAGAGHGGAKGTPDEARRGSPDGPRTAASDARMTRPHEATATAAGAGAESFEETTTAFAAEAEPSSRVPDDGRNTTEGFHSGRNLERWASAPREGTADTPSFRADVGAVLRPAPSPESPLGAESSPSPRVDSGEDENAEGAASSSEGGIPGVRSSPKAGGADGGDAKESHSEAAPYALVRAGVGGPGAAPADRRSSFGVQPSSPNPSSRLAEALEPPPGSESHFGRQAQAARSLRVDLPGASASESLRLRFLQRGNAYAGGTGSDIDVRIQSSSERVAHELRAALPALLGRLERAGFDAGRTGAEDAGELRGDGNSSSSRQGNGQSDGGQRFAGGYSAGQDSAGQDAETGRHPGASVRGIGRSPAGAAFAGNLARALHRQERADRAGREPANAAGISANPATER